ncbi:ABC transporter ATP-binding protein SaoA [Fusobacteria bacterium ZRK30]|nr:ABC transporter ATP-binding protein SaoA [Fusobacteria bacterium ZRK30]
MVEIKNISKVFSSKGEENTVLQNVNLTVNKGEFITLLGPSGCGKTTLLTMMAGFQKPTSGEIWLGDEMVTKPSPKKGFVFQNYALFPWMTVKENILYPMKQQKLGKDEMEKRFEKLIEIAHLEGKEDLYPKELSGGMKQRTAFVRALAGNPKILLLDEPLGAIDFQMRKSIQVQLEKLWQETKITTVMVTHDVEEALYLSDRVIVMSKNRGEIIKDFKVQMERPRNREFKEYKDYKKELEKLLELALKGV